MEVYKKLIEKISKLFATISAVCLFIIVFVTVFDVGGRILFNRPVYGTLGTIRTLLVFVIFFSLPFAQVSKTHIRVEFILQKMNKYKRHLLLSFGLIYNILIVGFLTYGCIRVAQKSFMMKEKLSGIMNYPVWPGRYAVAIGLFLLSLQYLVDIYDYYKTYQIGKRTK